MAAPVEDGFRDLWQSCSDSSDTGRADDWSPKPRRDLEIITKIVRSVGGKRFLCTDGLFRSKIRLGFWQKKETSNNLTMKA